MFKNPDIQRAASQSGFAVIDANLNEEVEQLYAYISNHFKFPTTDFYYSLMANTYEANKTIQQSLLKILDGFLKTNFTGHKILNASFLAKPANTKEEFLLHQDWCYTDEKSYDAYNIWIPLSDVTAENGAMFFLPGSHLWFDNFRSGSLHSSRITSGDLLKPHLQTVPLKKGQAIVFNPAVFHGSHPNLSNENRLVVTSTVLPEEAPFLYFQKSETENEVSVFDISADAFLKDLERLAFAGRPESMEINRMEYTHRPITETDQMTKLATFETP
jgi:ectoine hydroxylase-related dioxygenase (phytanoyl-CoA dioxygenase family)